MLPAHEASVTRWNRQEERAMAIIDSQVHAYEANTPKRPWHSVPNWPDHQTALVAKRATRPT